MLKIILKIFLLIICLLVILVIGLLIWLTVTEFSPDATEPVTVTPNDGQNLHIGDSIKLLSFNIGYGALGADADFFMDGGSSVMPDDVSITTRNLDGIREILKGIDADVYLLQEVDTDSKRNFYIDETKVLSAGFDMSTAYALNFSCKYVPFPFPTIGKVNSGLFTLSNYPIADAQRISLPCPFSWPVRMANLKRCLLVTRIELEDTNQQLVLVNLHLDAYDDGEGRREQLKVLTEILNNESEKGNFVIAGGDFNSFFPGADNSAYPIYSSEHFMPATIDANALTHGYSWVFDDTTATSRLLNRPYDPAAADTQEYVIDGYIISSNVELISVKTLDKDYAYSDHNPVMLTIVLKG